MENMPARLKGVEQIGMQTCERGFLFSGEESILHRLIYVARGKLRCAVNGQGTELNAGELVLLTPGVFYMYYADVHRAPVVLTATFRMEGAGLPCGTVRAEEAPEGLLSSLVGELSRPDAYSEDMSFALLTQLLVTLCREEKAVDACFTPAGGEGAIVARAQQYIASHAAERLSVPLVAKTVGVSPSYLTALFHKRLDMAPGEYIRRVKLQLSRQMIRRGGMSLTEIAAALNYSTVHHFSRQFREKFGITPSDYGKTDPFV